MPYIIIFTYFYSYDAASLIYLYPGQTSADLSVHLPHSELDLVSADAEVNFITYPCCPNQTFQDITYMFQLQRLFVHRNCVFYARCLVCLCLFRHPLYYIINFMLPCAFIEAISIMVFLLPPECKFYFFCCVSLFLNLIVDFCMYTGGEKVSLSVTLVLGMTVLLMLIAENMPPSSYGVPLIG